MKLYPRRRQQYRFAALVAGAVVLSVAFFFLAYWPARRDFLGLEDTIEEIRRQLPERAAALENLEALAGRLDQANQERLRFLGETMIPRNQGFSTMLPDLERLAQQAGVVRSAVSYETSPQPENGVYAVSIQMPVRGSYAAISRFIRSLETSSTLFLLDSIALGQAQGQGAAGQLDAQMNLTTFFIYDR